MNKKFKFIILVLCFLHMTGCFLIQNDLKEFTWPSYMIYYGRLNDELIEQAQKYNLVILHPSSGDLRRDQIARIQEKGTQVLGYLSIGEDLRTAGLSAQEMLNDVRFQGDKSGPRVDSREDKTTLEQPSQTPLGLSSGSGYASYYLDDNDHDGKPDFNPSFSVAYTNISDPAWYEALNGMTLDGIDQVAGMQEILTTEYGRGLGLDGLFLDTIDTCAPNSYTRDEDLNKTRFEWTAPGIYSFTQRLKEEYPDKLIAQNRGLFFYDYHFKHFEYKPSEYIDFLMYENYFPSNQSGYTSKIQAEANRPNGFQILSLEYIDPKQEDLKQTLLGNSKVKLDYLLENMESAQEKSGFSHYITDPDLVLANDFVFNRRQKDLDPPIWQSVHNLGQEEIKPRIGIGAVEPSLNGVMVSWDNALDKSQVNYTLYYQTKPFDFESDPDLKKAHQVRLIPEVGSGYGYKASYDTWPYQAEIDLEAGKEYYFVIRAQDKSLAKNEEKNRNVLSIFLS